MRIPDLHRRRLLVLATALAAPSARAQPAPPQRQWFDAAEAMRRLALGWGDQPYGAVVVQGGRIIGEGPSRVVQRNDPNAHAEREAIRDARERFGPEALRGAVLYSTSRPCALCEAAAAAAGIARMIHGADFEGRRAASGLTPGDARKRLAPRGLSEARAP